MLLVGVIIRLCYTHAENIGELRQTDAGIEEDYTNLLRILTTLIKR